MARINPINLDEAQGKTKELCDAVKTNMGRVPNILKTMAHSPSILKTYLDMASNLSETSLSAQLREQISLLVSKMNGCNYCLKAHGAIAAGMGISEAGINDGIEGTSQDEKVKAIFDFVKVVVEKRAEITDCDLKKIKDAGVNDVEIVEIMGVIALNMFTNYFNHVVKTEIDF